MEDNKYYTPELSDFLYGLEYEFLSSNKFWKKFTFNEDRSPEVLANVKVHPEMFRVKYLDKEAIEAAGFKKVGDQFESIKTYLGVGTGDDKKLCIYLDEIDHSVDIWYRSNRGDLFTKFEGIVKNKSKFLDVLKMIRVK